MKQILKYAIAVAIVLNVTACSSDYLETAPTNAIDDEQLLSSVENYGVFINGINQLMITQQGAFGQGYCGMSTVLMYLGETCGNDWHQEAMGGFNSANMALCINNNAAFSNYAWYFLYSIIGNANRIISSIDNAEGDESLRSLYKAQALTYRAYSYYYLVQIFSKRWMDSNNGSSDGVVLRLDTSTGPQELATLAKCYEQIYQDCDDAIGLFEESDASVTDFYQPSINMAYGVKARAALSREDWETAAEAANKAREGFTLMTQDEFTAGFCNANDEWIYGGYASSEENMWYYSFGAYYAYNGYLSGNAYNVVGNRELVDQFADTDVRKSLFLHQNLFPEDRFVYNETVGSYAWASSDLSAKMINYMKSVPGVAAAINTTGYYPVQPSIYNQLKFACFDLPGVSQMCFMRAAEMYLIEAEALCKQQAPDESTARNLLYTVNSARDDAYTQTAATGQELIDEILLTRRMELWGEGFSWFDLKRLGASISRKTYADTSGAECPGTFGRSFAVTVGPNDQGTNDWVWVIPLSETQYNDLIK